MQSETESYTDSNVSSGNSKKICRMCKIELVVGATVKRSDLKTCTNCLDTHKVKNIEDKTEKPHTIKCSKCKKYQQEEQFIKLLRMCTVCREKECDNRNSKKKGIEEQEVEEQEEYEQRKLKNISAMDIYNYLKKKYNIKEDINAIVNDILLQEEEEDNADDTEL